jgi:hypothetical protein
MPAALGRTPQKPSGQIPCQHQVCLFVSCNATPIAYSSPISLSCSDLVHHMANSDFASFSQRLLQIYRICFPFFSRLQRCYHPYVRPGAYMLNCSDHWKRRLPFSVLNRPVRDLARTDGTAPQPSVPSEHKNDGWTADIHRPRPTSGGYRICLDVTQFDPDSAR